MVYEFNCTKCGKSLTQETVLYEFLNNLYNSKYVNLDNLIDKKGSAETDSKPTFRKLRVRLLLSELQQIMGNRWDAADPVVCHLGMEQILRYMGNERNLNIKGLEKLTLDDIECFAFRSEKKLRQEADELFKIIDSKQFDDNKSASEAVTLGDLQKEFEHFLYMFKDGCLDFGLELKRDSINREAITGFDLYRANGDQINRVEVYECHNPRYCSDSECGAKLFDRAGAAKQIKIGFLGKQGAGKTSAILAAAHALLKSRAAAGKGSPQEDDLRELVECMSSNKIRPIDCSNDPMVIDELEKYSKGQAPAKTQARKVKGTDGKEIEISQAYAITLQLRDDLLVTLTDIPGEAFDETNGHIRKEILKKFESVVRVDAFVFCYDASRGADMIERVQQPEKLYQFPEALRKKVEDALRLLNARNEEMVRFRADHELTCKWLTEIKNEWSKKNGKTGKMPPVLILYMKDPSVENDASRDRAAKERENKNYNGIFREEQTILDTKELGQRYRQFREEFGEQNKEYYYTELRCSPYGFVATNDNVREHVRNLSLAARQNALQISKTQSEAEKMCTELKEEHRQKKIALEAQMEIHSHPEQWQSCFEQRRDSWQEQVRAAQTASTAARQAAEEKERTYSDLKKRCEELSRKCIEAADAARDAEHLKPQISEIDQRYAEYGRNQESFEKQEFMLQEELNDLNYSIEQAVYSAKEAQDKGDKSAAAQWDTRIAELQEALRKRKNSLDDLKAKRDAMDKEMNERVAEDQALQRQYQNAVQLSQSLEANQKAHAELNESCSNAKNELDDAEQAAKKAEQDLMNCSMQLAQAEQILGKPELEQRMYMEQLTVEAKRDVDNVAKKVATANKAIPVFENLLEIAEARVKDAENNLDKVSQMRSPEPKNVGHLARWILYVCGAAALELSDSEGTPIGSYTCRPPELKEDLRAAIKPNTESQNKKTGLDQLLNLFKQIRGKTKNLFGTMEQEEFEECRKTAAAHCYLFVNPTEKELRMRECPDPSHAAEILRDSM